MLNRIFIIVVSMLGLVSCERDTTNEPRPISMGVFGGSTAARDEAMIAKSYWATQLDMDVITYAVGGAGYSDYRNNTIQMQLEKARAHNYFLLWCSTNDYGQAIENNNKYSKQSQNGGLRFAIEHIKSRHPKAKIILFTSLPSMDGRNMSLYVENQIKVCKEYDIAYLDQFKMFDSVDIDQVYQADQMHITKKGYEILRVKQVEFFRKIIKL